MADDPGFLLPQGNYQELLSYRKSVVVYDVTCRFCERFLRRGDRTIDQMVQAARSGKQNILEGSKASKTSTEMEIKLTNVARASLEELLEDCREFVETRPAETVANIAHCLIHQANYLLDRQIQRLEKDFLEKGGIRERMTRARVEHRKKEK